MGKTTTMQTTATNRGAEHKGISTPTRLSYVIARLDRIVSRRLSDALAPYGITLPQYAALSVLQGRGALSNAQLAERSHIKRQSANEVVKSLEANGWVSRQADPTNRRIVLLEPTWAGLAILERCHPVTDQIESEMLTDLDESGVSALRTLLQTCTRNLR